MNMPVHEQILETANRIAGGRRDWRFTPDEIVRALPHLNVSTVRTHVCSRCCVNAPKNHKHKWDYFRRLGRGVYQVMPQYRQQAGRAATRSATLPERTAHSTGGTPARRTVRDTIHAVIQRDDSVYVAECLELAVVTQGRTLDELVENLRQAVALHLEGENMDELGLADRPRLQLVYDMPVAS